MALTNEDKRDLADLVKGKIRLGYSVAQTIQQLKRLGFKPNTIRQYYKGIS